MSKKKKKEFINLFLRMKNRENFILGPEVCKILHFESQRLKSSTLHPNLWNFLHFGTYFRFCPSTNHFHTLSQGYFGHFTLWAWSSPGDTCPEVPKCKNFQTLGCKMQVLKRWDPKCKFAQTLGPKMKFSLILMAQRNVFKSWLASWMLKFKGSWPFFSD